MVWFYVFGLIGLIKSMMGYPLNVVQVGFLVLVAYGINGLFLKTPKRIVYSLIGVLIASALSIAVLSFLGFRDAVIQGLIDFVAPYIRALQGQEDWINDPYRQSVVVILLTLIVGKIMVAHQRFKHHEWLQLSVLFVIMGIGFVGGRLSSVTDRPFIAIALLVWLAYYFDRMDLKTSTQSIKKALQFAPMIAYYGLTVVGLGWFLFSIQPYPFYREPVSPTRIGSESIERTPFERYTMILERDGHIREQFEFKGVEVFQVKRTHSRYLRAFVYESYNGQWQSRESDLEQPILTREQIKSLGIEEIIEITHTNILSPVLFSAGHQPDDLKVPEGVDTFYDDDRQIFRIENALDDLRGITMTYGYKTTFLPKGDYGLKEQYSKPDQLDNTLYSLREIDGYLYDIMADLVTPDMSDYDKIQAVVTYLKTGFDYTVTPIMPNEIKADPIETFLTVTYEGFCQQYASAAALLLRTQGIKTRYISGYLIQDQIDYNRIQYEPYLANLLASGYLPVKDEDAHTWIEVYSDGFGWVPFEATGLLDPIESASMPQDQDITPEAEEGDGAMTQGFVRLVRLSITGASAAVLLGLMGVVFWQTKKRRVAFENGDYRYKIRYACRYSLAYLEAIDFKRKTYESFLAYGQRVDASIWLYETLTPLMHIYERLLYSDCDVHIEDLEDFEAYWSRVKVYARKKGHPIKFVSVWVREWLYL